ncbi:MAG: hypothetical protein JWR85_3357 [Marmoricola sp.]|nr:hypothetical protein [Marmoricola sp.]
MTSPPPDVTASYEFRVQGHLDQYWSAWFDGFTITHHDDGTTTLHGVVRDQAELHGLLAKVRDLGTALISVTPRGVTGSDDTATDSQQQQHP